MRRLLAVLTVALACLIAPNAGAWNQYASIDEVATWLAMRPVTAKCLNKWESDRDFVIAVEGAAAYVEGFYDQGGTWLPDDHMVVATPICKQFAALASGDTEGYDFAELAFSVLVVTHESGHLRGWRKKTLTSDSESSTERWALRHIYAVSRHIGLSPEAAVLVLRFTVQAHRDLPEQYHAWNCKLPYVDEEGRLQKCGAP